MIALNREYVKRTMIILSDLMEYMNSYCKSRGKKKKKRSLSRMQILGGGRK